jgi:drug/metabolite transporter (DMT)-like permease
MQKRSPLMNRWYLTLGTVTLGWGTIPVVAGEVRLPAALIVAGRVWTASLFLAIGIYWRRRTDRKLERAGPPPLFSVRTSLCVLVGAILASHWLALFAAYKRAPAGTVILIVYLAPIGVALVAPATLGEHLSRQTLTSLVAATAGFALLAAPTLRTAGAMGLAYSLAAAVLFVSLIILSKPLAACYGGLSLAFMEMTVAGVALVPVALMAHWPRPAPSWLWLLVLGGVHTAVGTGLYFSALGYLPATHVGILGYLEPVGVVICAWILLSERPSWQTVLGGVIVVAAGILLVVRREAAAPRGRVEGRVAADSQDGALPSQP